jgi:type IV secretory pathway VirB10-like protein
VPEGTYIDTVLTNRLSGEFAGPVEVMVTNPVYSGDRQHILIKDGSRVLGTVQKVGEGGQRRLCVTFHRILMPDYFSVDLDQFLGLDAKGETALKDQVNTHFLSSFFGAVAVGLIGGLSQATADFGPLGAPATSIDSAKLSAAQSMGQSAQNMLTSRFLNRLPTLTIREGARVKVYIAQDLALPAYDAHDLGNP